MDLTIVSIKSYTICAFAYIRCADTIDWSLTRTVTICAVLGIVIATDFTWDTLRTVALIWYTNFNRSKMITFRGIFEMISVSSVGALITELALFISIFFTNSVIYWLTIVTVALVRLTVELVAPIVIISVFPPRSRHPVIIQMIKPVT
jgi:hypothetical protein